MVFGGNAIVFGHLPWFTIFFVVIPCIVGHLPWFTMVFRDNTMYILTFTMVLQWIFTLIPSFWTFIKVYSGFLVLTLAVFNTKPVFVQGFFNDNSVYFWS